MNQTPVHAAAARPINVMLVDDHRSVLWGLEKLIDGERPRMQVVGKATCTQDAISSVQGNAPDVVLLDLDLDGESGLAVMAQLRPLTNARFIVLTGMRNAEVRDRAIVEGVSGIVLKSEPAEVILAAIERVYRGEVWVDGATAARVFASLSRGRTAAAPAAPGHALTPAERKIVASVVKHKGSPNKVIAHVLNISAHTLRNHLVSIYGKLGIHRRLELVLYAMECGLDVADE